MNRCTEVVKQLLIKKYNVEKHEARRKFSQNKLRLDQDNWQDGFGFQEISRESLSVG